MRLPEVYVCRICTGDMRREVIVAALGLFIRNFNGREVSWMVRIVSPIQEPSHTFLPCCESDYAYSKHQLGGSDDCKA